MVKTITEYSDLILKLANVLMLGFMFWKFTRKPQESLESRIEALEKKVDKLDSEVNLRHKDFERQLRQGNDKFRSIEKFLEVLLTCSLALINFEVNYCTTEHKEISGDLEEARKALNKCLSKINKEESVWIS